MEQKSNYEKSLSILENYKNSFTKLPIHKIMKRLMKCDRLEKNVYSTAEAARTYDYPIFFMEDIIAYSAILQFYTNKPEKALQLLHTLEKMLLVHKKNYTSIDEEGDVVSSLNTYGLKFSVMALNECYYDILLCHLVLRDYKAALKVGNELLITLKPQAAFWIVLIRYMIQQALGQASKGEAENDV